MEDWKQYESGHYGKTQEDHIEIYPAAKKKRSNKKRDTLHISGSNPQLRGQVGLIAFKNRHAFIWKGMEQVHPGDKQISDAYEKNIGIIQEMAGVPGQHEDGTGDNDTKHLCKAVKEQVAIKGHQV